MLIECKGLTFRYPESDTEVFRNLNCKISGPGFHALFGPSGVGKTTLAKIMTKEIPATSDSIVTDGVTHTLYSYNLERLPGWYSVRDHLDEISPASGKDDIDNLTSFFGLRSCIKSRFANLSLGQQNRANLVRYLLQEFDVLIMDESLANVDEATREHIILKIKKMFPTKTFLYVSHNLREISKLCRQILVVRDIQKEPQAVVVRGQDFRGETPPPEKDLERTMLEVVHAS